MCEQQITGEIAFRPCRRYLAELYRVLPCSRIRSRGEYVYAGVVPLVAVNPVSLHGARLHPPREARITSAFFVSCKPTLQANHRFDTCSLLFGHGNAHGNHSQYVHYGFCAAIPESAGSARSERRTNQGMHHLFSSYDTPSS